MSLQLSHLETKAHLYMHIAVILFGFTAILGDLITLSAIVLVWWRVFLTSGSLVFFFKWKDILALFETKKLGYVIGVGVIVGLHWLCFYGAIKEANATIALVCMSTTLVFTALLEPIIHQEAYRKLDLLLGLFMIPCFLLLVNYTPQQYISGMGLGLLSALLASLFSIFNKKLIESNNVFAFTFVELFSACIFLSICLSVQYFFFSMEIHPLIPNGFHQWFYLGLLAFLCTTLAYVLALKSLQHISAFASNMIINLEPVYGIVLAYYILGDSEHMHFQFYIGAVMIVVLIFIYPFLSKRIV
ncbi:MAG: DMT family transporter [Saprospiraceae bacterium]